MTQDEIIRSPLGREQLVALAQEAGFDTKVFNSIDGDEVIVRHGNATSICISERLERFAVLVAAHEREACAKACDEIEQDRWNLYKGRPPYTGSESGRADPHEQGVSMGAGECAVAIRARGE